MQDLGDVRGLAVQGRAAESVQSHHVRPGIHLLRLNCFSGAPGAVFGQEQGGIDHAEVGFDDQGQVCNGLVQVLCPLVEGIF